MRNTVSSNRSTFCHSVLLGIGLIMLAAAILASPATALADWVNTTGVIYQFHDSGHGGIVYPHSPAGSRTALYGATITSIFPWAFNDVEGLDETQAAPYIFDNDSYGIATAGVTDYISLPGDTTSGDPNDTTYIIIGASGQVLQPQAGMADLQLHEFDPQGETAYVYVSNKIVTDPESYDWVFNGETATDDDFDYVGVAVDDDPNSFDLYALGFTDPIQAILIQGRDVLGTSFGFDLVSVKFEATGLETNVIPEPASLVLLGLGVIGLVGIGRRRRRR